MDAASGVILAGGASRRMGSDKAWLTIQGRALIQRVLDRLKEVCREVIVVANDAEAFARLDVTVVGDIFQARGSLAGIHAGLQAARFEHALVVACDMPFLNPALLRDLIRRAEDCDVVIPSAPDPSKPKRWKTDRPTAKDSDLHPLHAVYSKHCLEPMEERLGAGDLRMISFYDAVRVCVVPEVEITRFDPQHLSLFNVNTPEDLTHACELARQLAGAEPPTGQIED